MLVYWRVPTFTIQNYNQCRWIGPYIEHLRISLIHLLEMLGCAERQPRSQVFFAPLKFNMDSPENQHPGTGDFFWKFQVLCWTFGGVSFVVCFSLTDDWRLKHTDYQRFLLLTVYTIDLAKKNRYVFCVNMGWGKSFSGTSMLASMCSFHWRINRKFVKFSRWFQITNVFFRGKMWSTLTCTNMCQMGGAFASTNIHQL